VRPRSSRGLQGYCEGPPEGGGSLRAPWPAAEDGVLERLRGDQATGAGGGGVRVPRGVGAEVALPRSYLEETARGELV